MPPAWPRRCAPAALLALGVAACVPDAGGRELVAMVEDATLVSWPVLEELTTEFEARHGVRVELVDLSGAAGSKDKLKFLLAGDLPLDLVRIDVTEAAAYLAESALVDLEPLAEGDPAWDPDAFFPGPLAACRDARGHLYGLPQTFTPYVMYVNRDLLRALGRPLPGADWTWDDFLALARAGTRDTDGDGRTDQFGVSLTQWLQAVVPWIWQNGGELLDAGGTRSRMGERESVEALAFLHGLLHTERIASFDATFAGQLSQGLFQAGRALFYGPVGYWETYRFRHLDAFEWDVLPLPRRARAATSVAMSVYVVPRTAREPELAWSFLREVLCGPRYQRVMAEIGNGVPGLVDAAHSDSFLRPGEPPASARVFLEVMDDARFMPPLANWRKIESLCQAELEGVLLTGAVSPADAARGMAAKTDAYLARERARQGRPRLPRGTLTASVALALLALAGGFLARRGPRPPPSAAREERHAALMLAPWALGFVAFLFGPAVVALVMSLTEWSPLRPASDMGWVGLDNYARLAEDDTFRTSLAATTLYALLAVPFGLVVALALALLLRRATPMSGVVRTVCYVPAVLSPVIVAAVWRHLLDDDRGLFNSLLRALGLEGVPWLRDPDWVVPSFALMAVWGVGAQMLVFLAALQAVDPSLEEAARVDGAGAWRRFLHVTLPALTPVVLFNLVTGLIVAFQVFAQPYVMTQGGPGDASRFLVLYLYESGFRHLDMGYASAIAWVLFGLLAVLALALLSTARHWVHYAGRAR